MCHQDNYCVPFGLTEHLFTSRTPAKKMVEKNSWKTIAVHACASVPHAFYTHHCVCVRKNGMVLLNNQEGGSTPQNCTVSSAFCSNLNSVRPQDIF